MRNDSNEESGIQPTAHLLSESLIHTKVEMDERSERQSRLSYSSSFSALHAHPTNSAFLTTFLLINTMIGSGEVALELQLNPCYFTDRGRN